MLGKKLPSDEGPLDKIAAPVETTLSGLLHTVRILPEALSLLRRQEDVLRALIGELRAAKHVSEVGWLDTKAAAAYLGISRGSFDKYRYQTTPSIKGYPLDGKVLYRKGDLDSFVMLYAVKSQGGRL